MGKPKDADYYGWTDFVAWCERNGVDPINDHVDDWGIWWSCWKAAYCSAMDR